MSFLMCDLGGHVLQAMPGGATMDGRPVPTLSARVPKSQEHGRFYGSVMTTFVLLAGGATSLGDPVQLLDTAQDKARKLSKQFKGLVVVVRGQGVHSQDVPWGLAENGMWYQVRACRKCPKYKSDPKECECAGRGWERV